MFLPVDMSLNEKYLIGRSKIKNVIVMLKFLLDLFKKSGPSKTKTKEKKTEILHKKCGNIFYYSDGDIHYGDLEIISSTESLQRGYLNCPHCKKQLVFDYNI